MTLVAALEAQLAASGGEGEGVLGYLAELLADGDLMQTELGDTEAAIEEAESDERTAETWLTGAFERFPINTDAFPHSSHVDPRAHAVLATHRLAQRARLYMPSEPRAMQERDEVIPAWRAREGLRFRLYSALVRALGEAMVDGGGVTAAVYVTNCQSMAKELGAIEIAAPQAPPAQTEGTRLSCR